MRSLNHLTDAELARIDLLVHSASPGPWKSYIEGRDHSAGSDFVQTPIGDIEMSGATVADHDFIASARQDVPRLVAEVRMLRRLLEEAGKA
jgi:hypothetical protein